MGCFDPHRFTVSHLTDHPVKLHEQVTLWRYQELYFREFECTCARGTERGTACGGRGQIPGGEVSGHPRVWWPVSRCSLVAGFGVSTEEYAASHPPVGHRPSRDQGWGVSNVGEVGNFKCRLTGASLTSFPTPLAKHYTQCIFRHAPRISLSVSASASVSVMITPCSTSSRRHMSSDCRMPSHSISGPDMGSQSPETE